MFCFVLAGIFYFLLVLRRKIIGPAPERQIKRLSQLGRPSKIGLTVMAAISLLRCFELAVLAPSNLVDCYIKSAIRSARAAMVFEGFNPIASGMMEPSAT